eukprot:11888920-Alexandrium_andersonii.AAC.1
MRPACSQVVGPSPCLLRSSTLTHGRGGASLSPPCTSHRSGRRSTRGDPRPTGSWSAVATP